MVKYRPLMISRLRFTKASSITGPRACRKSMLQCILAGMLHPDNGLIEINGRDLNTGDTNAIRSTEIGFIFQKFHLVSYLNVI